MMKTYIYTLVCFLGLVAPGLQAQMVKIGHTRIDYIVSQMPEAKKVNDQLSVEQTQAENELKRLQKELQEKYALYQKQLSQLSDAVRKDKETELQTLQNRIEEFSRTADASLQNKYKQLMTPILAKIQQTIDTVAKQNGYSFILNAGGTSRILYGAPENDITDLVLKQIGITPEQISEKPAPKPTTPVKTGTSKKK